MWYPKWDPKTDKRTLVDELVKSKESIVQSLV